MNRRKYLSLFGVMSGSLLSGSYLSTNEALSVSFNIDGNTITPNSVTSDNLVVTFSDVTIYTNNLEDTSSSIFIEVYAESDLTSEKANIDTLSVHPDSDENIEISSLSVNLNNNKFSVSNSQYLRVGIRASHPDVDTQSYSKIIVKPSKVPSSGVSKYLFENSNNSTNTGVDNWSSNNIDISGAVYDSYSKFGSTSLYFDGNNDDAVVPIGSDLYSDEFSVSMWVDLNGTYNNKSIINYPTTRSRNWSVSSQNVNNNADYELIINNNSVISTSSYPTTEFVNIIVTHDASTSKLYINGDLIGSHTEDITLDKSADKTRLANVEGGQNGDYTQMNLDNLTYYNKAIS